MTVIGLSPDLLAGFYNARLNQSALASAASAGRGAPASGSNGAGSGSSVRPPWDVRGGVTGLDVLSREALGSGVFFKSREFSDLDAPQDHKDLFALHQGLRRMYALASEASEDATGDSRRAFLDRRFQEGLVQLDSFVRGLDLQSLNVVSGALLDDAETARAIADGEYRYVSGVIHEGEFDAAVDAFQGDVQLGVGVTKNGSETLIAIDLADMGATPRTLDNVAAHINSELEAAGVLTRFGRVKIGEENEFGIVEGDRFGFEISGVLTEKIRFDAAGAPSAYMIGNSGGAAGQLSKIDGLAGAAPEYAFIKRIEADAPPPPEEGEDPAETPPVTARAVATGPNGEIYALLESEGPVDGLAPRGERDLLLVKYDSTGKRVYSRALGAAESVSGAELAVDAAGDVVITGTVTGALGDSLDLGDGDAFAAKYSADGTEQWLQRFGSADTDAIAAVAVSSGGAIFVAGTEKTGVGVGAGDRVFIRAYDADGQLLQELQPDAISGHAVTALALDGSGGLAVATKDSEGVGRITKFTGAAGQPSPVWTQTVGDLDGGQISAMTYDGTSLYLGGSAGAGSTLAGQFAGHAGARDGVIARVSDNGTAASLDYAAFLGSPATDEIAGIQVEGGSVYATGRTLGALPGGGALDGSENSFLARFDAADGALAWTSQLTGRGGKSAAVALAIDPRGDSVLDQLGLPRGTLDYGGSERVVDHTAARPGDSFTVSVDGGRARSVEIEADDTYLSLTFKINAVLVLDGKASVSRGDDGDRLRIEAREGVTIELGSGPDGRDALGPLGFEKGVLYEAPETDEDADEASAAPPLYGLGVDFSAALLRQDGANAAAAMLSEAMLEVQAAYRKLTAPDLDSLKKPKGEVPAYLTARIANFQAGLDRLNAGGPAPGGAGLLL